MFSYVTGAAQQRRTAAPTQDFNTLAAQAGRARETNQLNESIALYRQALVLRPKWDEGWWYLATLLYDRDLYPQAADAFKRAAELQPKAGAAWGMLGLCEFQLSRYDDAYKHLRQGRQVGLPKDNVELARVMRYHEALLLILKGDFETAQQALDSLSYEGVNSRELIAALGYAVLRVQALPSRLNDVQAADLIKRAGNAEYLSATKKIDEARREYEKLVADYPKTHNVQYALGSFLLLNREDEKAVMAFQREIENTPIHRLARLQIAQIKLKNKDAAGGLPFAEESVRLYPDDPLGHYILGRLLFDVGQTERAIKELETAQRSYPDEPKIYFQLARAYARVNRKEDAERARASFSRLKKQSDESAGGDASPSAPVPNDASEMKPAKP